MQKDYGTPELHTKKHFIRWKGGGIRELDPLRIDKLLASGIITETQHYAALRYTMLYLRANRSLVRVVDPERLSLPRSVKRGGFDNMARLDAETALQGIRIAFAHEPSHSMDTLYAVCIEEISVNMLARRLRRRKAYAVALLQETLDALSKHMAKQ